MREKVGKSRNTVFFKWFGAPEGRKVGSLKRRVRSQLARWEMKKCTPLWREAHFQVKMYRTPQCRTTFGSWDVEKVHAVVARSTFRSQNVQNTRGSDHFWKYEMSKKCTPLWREAHFEVKMYKTPGVRTTFGSMRCRKSARRCGLKHISKSKCTKHQGFGPLLEVQMPKKCTPLWPEAHFEVKMYKTPHVRAAFGGSDVASLPYTTLHYTTLHYTTLHYTTLQLQLQLQLQLHNYTTTQLHNYTTTQLHNYTTTQLHSTTIHSNTLHYTKLRYTTLHYTTLRSTTLHYTTLPSTTLHYITLHYTTTTTTQLHSTTLHYTTLHWMTLHHR